MIRFVYQFKEYRRVLAEFPEVPELDEVSEFLRHTKYSKEFIFVEED